MATNIHYTNPEGLSKNPAFTQVVSTQGDGKTIYVGGQNSVNATGELVGKGNIQIQTEQVMRNLQTALAAYDATFNHVVKLNIHLVQGQDVRLAFQAAQPFIGIATHPPAITVLFVSGLVNPDFLVEVDAISFISEV